MQNGGHTVPRITRAEHIGPNDTGDNIEAKRVANYLWNGSVWERQVSGAAGFITQGYDYVSIAYPNDTTEVFTFKIGGSGGTTTNTVTITYVDSTKVQMSTVTKT